ncbi:hypothetical protein K438DRAFT_537334 [Mycena galopus ATCC 62051]|nr:hypothetical protein K438DRAFT_537334 [Mycena galopus ATCC 62051]
MFPLPFLVDLLSRLPALEHLTIGQLRLGSEYCDIINSDSETVPRQGSFPQSLLTLNLRVSRGSGFFFAWLLSLPELPVPRSLELALLLKEEDLPFEEYLRRAGSELESFSLSVDSWFGSRAFKPRAPVAQLCNQAQHAHVRTLAGGVDRARDSRLLIVAEVIWTDDRPEGQRGCALGGNGSSTIPSEIRIAAALHCGGCGGGSERACLHAG